MTRIGCIVLGSANLDLVAYAHTLPKPGETVLAERSSQSPGGKGANQAVAAAHAGARTFFVGAVGDDPFGEPVLTSLQAAGVDTTHVRRVGSTSTGLALITVDDGGHNLITVVPGANATVGLADVEPVLPLLEGGVVVMMQLEIPLVAVMHMASAARSAGATVVLTPAPARPLPRELLHNVDVLIPNEHEVLVLTEEPGDTVDDAIDALLAAGVGAVVVTLGSRGVLVARNSERLHLPAHTVHAVDTTAAGDTLAGALAARLSLGDDLPQATRYGNAAAALSVQKSGAQASMPGAEEIAEFLRMSPC